MTIRAEIPIIIVSTEHHLRYTPMSPVNNDPGGDVEPGVIATEGTKTSEFKAMAAALIKNAVALAVLLGWVAADHGTELGTKATVIAGAAIPAVVEGVVLWKYIAARTNLKEKVMERNPMAVPR